MEKSSVKPFRFSNFLQRIPQKVKFFRFTKKKIKPTPHRFDEKEAAKKISLIKFKSKINVS